MPTTRRAVRAALAAAVIGALTLTAGPAPASSPPDARARAGANDDAAGSLGRWRVQPAGTGMWEVSWRSPSRLPVTSDRPTVVQDGVPLGVPTVRADGRTVVTSVSSRTRPDPATLDVVLSGDRLDEPGSDTADEAAAPISPRRPADLAPQLSVDPAEPGPYDVVSSDYQLDPVKLPRMREPIEMVGHVVEPAPEASTGPRPLVLFLHGRHSFCYDPTGEGGDEWNWPCQAPLEEIPSHLGYDYIQQVLASQGFATVSVRVNGINAQDYRLSDGGADARAQIVQRHLDYWVGLADDHQVDLSQVVLVGHSRGGEGVDRASIQIQPDAPYTIAGQVLLAPTDFGTQTAPYVPTVTVLPYCDGDVYDLQGQRFTDSSRDVLDDDTSLKSSVLVMGANHNFFNTEWTPGIAQAPAWDDWWSSNPRTECGEGSPTRLTASEQRRVGVAYVAGAVQLFTRDDQSVLPMFDGSVVRPPSIGAAEVYSHAIGGGRDERRPAIDTGLSLAQGARTSFCLGVIDPRSVGACGQGDDLWGNAPHWYDAGELAPPRRELEMTWTDVGQSGGLVLDDPLDLSDGRLEMRTIVDPLRGNVRLHLRLTDADGATATVTPADDGLVRALPLDRFVGKRWAQTVLADPQDAAGIDLTRITRIDVVGDSEDGHIWVLDVASAPDTLAPVPDERAPLFSLGSVKVEEGDGPGTVTAEVPFTITGTLTEPAQLKVGTVDYYSRGGGSSFRLDLAPGQTSGTIPIEYEANTADDPGRRITMLQAFPVRGVMTDHYDGTLRIIDDDPAPRVSVSAARRVSEGDPVRIDISLEGESAYPYYVEAQVVRSGDDVEPLRVGDVPTKWLRDHHVSTKHPKRALYRADVFLWTRIRPGGHSAALTIPTLRDGKHEGVEAVTVEIYRGRLDPLKRTVRVVD